MSGEIKSYQRISHHEGGLAIDLSVRFTYFGYGLTSLGSPNEDGLTHLVVGAPAYDQYRRGVVFVLL